MGEEELAQWRAEQAVEEMLATLHRIPVQAGAAILVPAGVPHAIGPGVLVLELQQPTDFGIALERRSDRGGDLGLGPEVALTAVDRSEWSPDASAMLSWDEVWPDLGLSCLRLPTLSFVRSWCRAGGSHHCSRALPSSSALRGKGELKGDFSGGPLSVRRGSTILVPFGAGVTTVAGNVDVVVCRPADPATNRPPRPIV